MYTAERNNWLRATSEGAQMVKRDESADAWVFVMSLSAAAHNSDNDVYEASYKQLVGGSWVDDRAWLDRIPTSDHKAWAASIAAIAAARMGHSQFAAKLLDLDFTAQLLKDAPSKSERALAMSNLWFAEYVTGGSWSPCL